MTPHDFTNWLRGYLDGAAQPDPNVIREKLDAVQALPLSGRAPIPSVINPHVYIAPAVKPWEPPPPVTCSQVICNSPQGTTWQTWN